jgi:hypothetical protein
MTIGVRSNSIRNMLFSVVDSPVGAQDSNQMPDNWHPGNQESGNERSVNMKFHAGIGILQGPKSIQLRPSFIKQNVNFENS